MLTRYLSPAKRISADSIQDGRRRLGAVLGAGRVCASLIMGHEAAAQAQQPAPDAQTPSAPAPSQSENPAPGETLGEQLSRSKGVIEPPAGVDPEIEAPAPQQDNPTMRVIPPPGSPAATQTCSRNNA